MNRNTDRGQRNRKGKRVTFETQSQQWRVNRTNIQNINRNNKGSLQTQSGRNALQRAQAAYYGTPNKSPLLPRTTTSPQKNRLPVHERLGNVSNNVRARLAPKNNGVKKTVAQLVAEKRAIRQKLKLMEQKLRNNRVRVNPVQVQNKPNTGIKKIIAKRKRPQVHNFVNLAATDLSVSVANDFARQNELLNVNVQGLGRVRQLRKTGLHSHELNPLIQSEIAIIQQRNRLNPVSFHNPGINPAAAINGLNKVTRIQPNLGGYTTIVNEPKMTLHERFSML